MSKILKTIFIIAACVIVTLLANAFYDRQFKLSNIAWKWSVVDVPGIISSKQDVNLKVIVSQPFHYLDRGKQSFVFESHDKKFVLKFFDNRCSRSGWFPFLFSISQKKCERKFKRLLDGYQIASAYDEGNTGLVYSQLVPSYHDELSINLFDRFGIKHVINLSEVPFVIQYKAVPLRQLISSLLDKGNVEGAQKRLYQIVDMYMNEYQRGIVDLDRNFMYNTGFVGERPIRIDLGGLKLDGTIKDSTNYGKDLDKVFIKRLGEWLDRHYPKDKQEILDNIQKKIQVQSS